MASLNKDSKLWRSATEVETQETVQIQGQIPAWLNGSYLRVGPGKFDFSESDFSMNHWFDGFALIAKFQISGNDGTVSYSSKYLESDSYVRAIKAKRNCVSEFGTIGCANFEKNIFSRIISAIAPELSDNANVALFTLRNENTVYVTGETCYFHRLDNSNLNPVERFDTNKMFGLYVCTAHPITDEWTGDTYNIGTSVKTGLRYNVIKIPPPASNDEKEKDQWKRSKIICSINSRWSTQIAYTHSFGFSRNYIIFIEQPLLMNVRACASAHVQNRQESIRDWLSWQPQYPNKFYIIDKVSGKILNKSVEITAAKPFFFLHFINCFESEDSTKIIVDISVYDTPDIIGEAQELTRLRGKNIGTSGLNDDDLVNQARCVRFILPITNCQHGKDQSGKSIVISPELIMEKGLELPTINKQFQGKNYQFYYGSGLTTQGYFKNSIAKVLVNEKRSLVWRDSESFILGEPVFVANQKGGKEEDDGVIIVPMSDSRKGEPDMLLFIDPKNMTELGRAVFDNNIPCALHGIFVPVTENKD